MEGVATYTECTIYHKWWHLQVVLQLLQSISLHLG